MFSSDSAWSFNLILRNHSDDNDGVWRGRPEHRQRRSALQHRQTVSRQTFTEHVLHWRWKRRHCHSYSSHVTWQRGGLTLLCLWCGPLHRYSFPKWGKKQRCGVGGQEVVTRLKRVAGVSETKHPFIADASVFVCAFVWGSTGAWQLAGAVARRAPFHFPVKPERHNGMIAFPAGWRMPEHRLAPLVEEEY